jgi:hypothetical protein
MKKMLFALGILLLQLAVYSQTFEVKLAPGGAALPISSNVITHESATPVNSFEFNVTGAPAGTVYQLFLNGANPINYTPGSSQTMAWPGNDLRDKNVSVRTGGSTVLTIQFKAPAGGATGTTTTATTPAPTKIVIQGPQDEEAYMNAIVGSKNIKVTQFGIQINGSPNAFTKFTGKRYVHVLFDQFGNSVLGAVPSGISNLQYVIHVIYLAPVNKLDAIRYVIQQTSGEYNDAALYRNAGILDSLRLFQFRSGEVEPQGSNVINLRFTSRELLFSTSTNNIGFTISRLKVESFETYQTTSTSLGTYTIKMAPVYAGSFDIGLIRTSLADPDFALVNSATNPSQKVVQQSDAGNRGIVTVMATLYVSPFTVLRSLFNDGNVPWYKLTGRSFLDYSGNILDRVYPSFGVGFTDRTFENLLFGANIEVARGGSIFIGYHYGKVNVFDAPAGFTFGQTVMNQDEFNLRQGTKWKGAFAIGANVDLRIITNLFRAETGQ